MPTQQTTSTLVPKIAKKKERTFAPNDPRREAYLARARKQAVANGVVVDTLADSSEEKKRQLKKKVGDEQQERATKKAKVRDNGNNGGTSLVNQKKAAKKEKKKKKDEGMEKLSEQEKHHLKYGHGRRGVRVDTVQGPAYFSLNNEQLLEIGDKNERPSVDAVFIVSMGPGSRFFGSFETVPRDSIIHSTKRGMGI
jgi:hypothetical protein